MKSSGPVPPSETLSIGALAEHFGLATHVLRHWESMGLLEPARDGAGRRRYGPDDRRRIAVVLRAKEAGLSLDAIRTMLHADPHERRAALRTTAADLRARLTATRTSLDLVEHALTCAHEDITECPTYRRWVAGAEGS
ncbi:MerR family transcriptional regulator [Streptomyces sp. NPDC058001]|uniref:MerR family transcriptional regulator n=1 Tax=Streptomyces sp. NPDC058001 TaxID=3346300 RepID=UPI0036E7B301